MISAWPCLVEPFLSVEVNNSVHVLFGLLQALDWLQEIFLKRHEYTDITSVFSWPCLVEGNGLNGMPKALWVQANIWYTPENRPPLSLCCIMIMVRCTSVLYYNAHGQGQRDRKHYASSDCRDGDCLFHCILSRKNKVHGGEIVLANREIKKISVCVQSDCPTSSDASVNQCVSVESWAGFS